MALLSLSMDLVDSTAGKNAIARTCLSEAYAHEQFRTLAQCFYRVETALYQHLVNEHVPLASIFHMKSIGDEVWIVIELPDAGPSTAFNEIAVGVLRAALAAACRGVSFSFSRRPLTDSEECADPPQRQPVTRIWHPVKLYVDLIDDAVETSEIRLETFQRDLGSLLLGTTKGRKPTTPAPGSPSMVELIERLGGFALTPPLVKWRTDYIGPEVDHFFRCAKKAIAGRVVVGEWLLARLLGSSNARCALQPRRRKLVVPVAHAIHRFSVDERLHLRRIPDLKGFNEDYDAYVIRDRSIEKMMALAGCTGPKDPRRASTAAPRPALRASKRGRSGTSSKRSRGRGAP